MKRAKPDPTVWRSTTKGVESYRAARAEAQRKADEMNIDVGLEANDLFKTWHMFLLPAPKYRSGHELRCEVVRPMKLKE